MSFEDGVGGHLTREDSQRLYAKCSAFDSNSDSIRCEEKERALDQLLASWRLVEDDASITELAILNVVLGETREIQKRAYRLVTALWVADRLEPDKMLTLHASRLSEHANSQFLHPSDELYFAHEMLAWIVDKVRSPSLLVSFFLRCYRMTQILWMLCDDGYFQTTELFELLQEKKIGLPSVESLKSVRSMLAICSIHLPFGSAGGREPSKLRILPRELLRNLRTMLY